ncbi:phosphotransferase [Streptomyces sp. NPDC090025]|uniref:phosphotransferase n=1 Tax=Streptomyces sp. NPDC090025 TaxID=3365922 RepID=UPI003832D71E
MTLRTWADLPDTLRTRIAERLAAVGSAEPVAGGFTPGVRVRMPVEGGRAAFVKAIPADDALASMYRTEGAVNLTLPPRVGPRLLATLEADGWVVLAFDHVEGRHPDLSPGGSDLPLVMTAVAALAAPLSPPPWPEAPEFASHPVVDRATAQHRAMRGNTLLHCDIRSDNLLIGPEGVLFVDWALAHRGAAWLDAALLIPQLIMAGHGPESAEAWAARVPAYASAPEGAVTAFAASLTGYWTDRLDQGVPALRGYRRRAVGAGRAWQAFREA